MKSSRRTLVSNTPARSVRALRKPELLGLTIALGALCLPTLAQGASVEPQWAPGRLLVQPRPGLSDAEFDKLIKPHGGKAVGKIEAINVRIVQLPPQASEKAVEALLKHNKHLKFVERDMLVTPAGSANDTYYSSSWHLPKIQANEAWDVSSGEGAIIAVLDSGVNGSHVDLVGKLVPGWNFLDNNANADDVHGHGTAVAGAAAASTNNGTGIAAVAGGAKIMPIRIADANAYAYWSTVAQGLTWAANNGAHVANISYNGVSGSATVQNAAQYLKNRGGVTVVAAGNSSGLEQIAPSDTMITVSATASNDVKASFSSYGSYVDIAAPGVDIWTTVKSGGYQKWWGTSMASPVVAGVVGLMKAANPALSAADIEGRLLSTAVDLGTAGNDPYYGYGRVNAKAAVVAAASAVPADTVAPTVAVGNPTGGSTVKGLAAVDVAASDNVGVVRVELAVNGANVASDTVAPYGFSWDSTGVADGNATLSARAYDAAGNYSTHAVTVKVANAETNNTPPPADTTAPVASIDNPAADSRVSGNLPISASATDDVGVTSLRLFINNELVSSASGSSLSYRWNTRKVASGPHTITVEAEDAAGNKGSRSIQVVR